jgi:hypothetical protein
LVDTQKAKPYLCLGLPLALVLVLKVQHTYLLDKLKMYVAQVPRKVQQAAPAAETNRDAQHRRPAGQGQEAKKLTANGERAEPATKERALDKFPARSSQTFRRRVPIRGLQTIEVAGERSGAACLLLPWTGHACLGFCPASSTNRSVSVLQNPFEV